MDELARDHDFGTLRMLHVAPEPALGRLFGELFGGYETADIAGNNIDHQADLRNLPFGDESYDVVYASHVLEHIDDDHRALEEIRRVLRPSGFAVLPVPIVVEATIEYPEPSPPEHFHVRAPGADYFDRYGLVFDSVRVFSSRDFKARYQTFILEDRTGWPNESAPLRPPMRGTRHEDFVPVVEMRHSGSRGVT
ncbi:MAG: class I SAM-dependent methyltransferase [Coriobacteriia bacterium]|nr:class I SAM-dependent methyltransferase [Coriobacteriia bacterium]